MPKITSKARKFARKNDDLLGWIETVKERQQRLSAIITTTVFVTMLAANFYGVSKYLRLLRIGGALFIIYAVFHAYFPVPPFILSYATKRFPKGTLVVDAMKAKGLWITGKNLMKEANELVELYYSLHRSS